MEMETETGNLDSWEGFTGSNWLSVDNVKSEEDAFICTKVELDTENQRPMLDLENNQTSYKLSLNVTNANFVKNAGIETPNNLIGKKLFFRRSMAFSPSAKKDVQVLRIAKIE